MNVDRIQPVLAELSGAKTKADAEVRANDVELPVRVNVALRATLLNLIRESRLISRFESHAFFTGRHPRKRLFVWVFAACRASPGSTPPVSSLFGLQRMPVKREQLWGW